MEEVKVDEINGVKKIYDDIKPLKIDFFGTENQAQTEENVKAEENVKTEDAVTNETNKENEKVDLSNDFNEPKADTAPPVIEKKDEKVINNVIE